MGSRVGRVLLAALGIVLTVQSVLLGWALASPGTVPSAADVGIVGLAVLSALLLAINARVTAGREAAPWWRPDWRQWIVGGFFPGPNAGVFLGFLLRRREAVRADGPSGRWKAPLVAGVVLTTVGSVASNLYFDLSDLSPLGAVVLLAVFVAVGFTFVAAYYDIQYTSLALSAEGQDWFLDGYHWLAPLGFPIPGRVFFLAIYLFRRRILLGRVAGPDGDIERLDTGVGSPEASDGGDDDGDDNGSEDGGDATPLPGMDRSDTE